MQLHRESARQNIIKFFGGKCAHCGYCTDIRPLQLHHINNDGKEDRRRAPETRWKEIRDNPIGAFKKYKLLCANCHVIQTFEDDVWRLWRKKKGGANIVGLTLSHTREEVTNGQ